MTAIVSQRDLAALLHVRIVQVLAEAGPLTTAEVARACGVSKDRALYHLRRLVDEGRAVMDDGVPRRRVWTVSGLVSGEGRKG